MIEESEILGFLDEKSKFFMVHKQTLEGIVLILTWNKTLKLFQICNLFVTLKYLYDVEPNQLQDWIWNFFKNYICKIPPAKCF